MLTSTSMAKRTDGLKLPFSTVVALLLLVGLLALYVPTYLSLASSVWATDEQGHGPIILAISLWLMWQRRHKLLSVERHRLSTPVSASLIGFGCLIYVLGRTQQLDTLEVGSQILVLAGVFSGAFGLRAIRVMLFPLAFMLFMVPLPSVFVQTVTTPLKAGVSFVAESILHAFDYPVARSGVVISVGQYQLLVADACAGLNSMFTLEALGLFYMNLMGHRAPLRNVLLAISLVPIAFAANVVRVIILILVTYHFGDEAGQGFVHGFAGMVLFMVALVIMLTVDKLLGLIFGGDRKL